MKIQKRRLGDSLVYCIMCVISLGLVYLLRLVITMGIRCAFKDDE